MDGLATCAIECVSEPNPFSASGTESIIDTLPALLIVACALGKNILAFAKKLTTLALISETMLPHIRIHDAQPANLASRIPTINSFGMSMRFGTFRNPIESARLELMGRHLGAGDALR